MPDLDATFRVEMVTVDSGCPPAAMNGDPMAQRVQIILEDDIDGGDATETVTFGLDGVNYEIDLNDKNAAKLRDALAGYVGAGRRVSGRRNSGTRRSSSSSNKEDLSRIREWARANGYEVSDRGRISREVREAYAKANG
ncbi:histone-like nucleoid-structuring protein Lsr2 [Janibacter corallicola]|uniref:histone-like nucleoid-structuring protein Lsr2 n=1 Tax=Janibacter corallicola TaxID=415212 RepID=UPI0034E2EBF9